jgi:transcriptional regulator with XRE-family HTH domain
MHGNRPDRVARDALRLNLVFRRAKLRLSQTALAERAGISRPVVSDIEQGRANVTLDVLERIAIALETTAAQLLTPVQRGASDEDIERRLKDGPEEFVDAWDLLAAIDEVDGPAGKPTRYSNRGRKAVSA